MGYSLLALKGNILTRYPEIIRHNILIGLEFDEESSAYRITLRKDMQEASTVLSRVAADMLMCAGDCPCIGAELNRIVGNQGEP